MISRTADGRQLERTAARAPREDQSGSSRGGAGAGGKGGMRKRGEDEEGERGDQRIIVLAPPTRPGCARSTGPRSAAGPAAQRARH
eukprot:7030439-Pyramimonas_sp.AAC.1